MPGDVSGFATAAVRFPNERLVGTAGGACGMMATVSPRSLFASALLLAALAVAAFVYAVAGGPSAADDRHGMPAELGGKPQGHVYTGAVAEPPDVNPLTARNAVAQSLVLGVTHDTLLDRDARTGELRHALAQSYEVAADGMSCTFVLRSGVTFADGAPLTMADVTFGWELHEAGHLPLGFAGAAFARLRSVDVLDDARLRVHFRERYFANVAAVGTGWLVPQKRFFVAAVRRLLPAGEALPAVTSARFAELLDQVDRQPGPGTGPYALCDGHGSWQRRQSLVLARHEASWRRTVRPGSWNFAAVRLLFRDQGGARNALLLKELDWYSGADVDELLAAHDDVAAGYDKRVYDYPQLGVYRIVWNCRRAPFDDVRVRRALTHLIPREQALAVIGEGARVASAHAKPAAASYPKAPPPVLAPGRTRRLLREAGFDPATGKPLRLTLLALQGSEPLRRIAELFVAAARDAGVVVEVKSRELAAFVAEQQRGEWDGSLVLQWFDDSGDPYRFLHGKGRSNPGGWHDEEADRLATAARLELDPTARNELWQKLHELALTEQPAALIAHPVAAVLVRKDLRDFVPGAFGLRPEWAWVPRELQRR